MAVAGRISSPAQVFALGIGVFYLLTGVVGFLVIGTGSGQVAGIGLNPLHELIHIGVFGGLWIYSARSPATAKTANLYLGVLLLVIMLLGMPGALGWLNIGSGFSGHFVLTLVTGLLGIYFGTAGAGAVQRAQTRTS